jgi:hypothetical protein
MPSKDHIRIDASNINIVFDNLTDETRVYALDEEGWVWILDHEQMLKNGIAEKELENLGWTYDFWNSMELGDTVYMDYLTIRRIA